jgi:hypothetical protein
MLNRDPYDGLPYYCITCGRGFGEFCSGDSQEECRLETKPTAEARKLRRRPMTTAKPLIVES